MPLEFGLKDFIDIFLVALMLFYCYKVMKESRSLNVFFGVLIFVVFWLFVSQILEMKLLGSVLDAACNELQQHERPRFDDL